MQLEQALVRFPHLVSGSEQFVDMIEGTPLFASSVLIRIDVKHLFMSGSANQLADYPPAINEDPQFRPLVRRAVHWLCHNQYVETALDSDLVMQVVTGNGMGLRHSNAVADACFVTLADMWSTSLSVTRHFPLRCFCRFRDDLFAIF